MTFVALTKYGGISCYPVRIVLCGQGTAVKLNRRLEETNRK
jgi:hypothetical protein